MSANISFTELHKMAGPVRELILRMCNLAKVSHIGSAFSVVDLLICIYSYVVKDNLNKIILSKGHSASAFYAVLAKFGKISEKSLDNYCADGEKLAGHISHFVHSDINLSTGSLGHGLPYGAGMAIAKKLDLTSGKVFVIMSDGEMDEGTTWETALIANHFNLNNLIVIIDRNRLQSLASTESTIKLEPLEKKWISFGWDTVSINAHSYQEIIANINIFVNNQTRPVCIIANSIKGYGIKIMEDSVKWHYKSPSDDEMVAGLKELKEKFK
jgi:transketolase